MNNFFRGWVAAVLFVSLSSVSFAAAPPTAGSAGGVPNYTGRFGLGFILGEPTAITAKHWLTQNTALDFGLSYFYGNHFLLYADHLWHRPGLFGNSTHFVSQLSPYMGLGGGIYFWSDHRRPPGWRDTTGGVGVYARVPFGLEWFPGTPSLGVFLEIVPVVEVVPGIDVAFDGGIGVRYYF